MLLYWYRLENLGNEFPLLKEAYNETKLLYLSKKPTLYESINIIVNILKTTNTDINLLLRDRPFNLEGGLWFFSKKKF
jgi:hypothetical protein